MFSAPVPPNNLASGIAHEEPLKGAYTRMIRIDTVSSGSEIRCQYSAAGVLPSKLPFVYNLDLLTDHLAGKPADRDADQ